jgi:WD40 repeat protein
VSGLRFEQHWQGMLSDYVTAIAWSDCGEFLAASSAVGEVTLWRVDQTFHETSLQQGNGQSDFSRDVEKESWFAP